MTVQADYVDVSMATALRSYLRYRAVCGDSVAGLRLPGGNAGEAACELVHSPFAYTFNRPLGELDTAPRDCQARPPR